MKEDLRSKYKIKRKYFQHSAREVADGAVADEFINAFSAFGSFLVYYSFGSEADTHALIDRLLKGGKRVFLPRVEGKDIVAVEYFGDADGLTKNALGVEEPQGQAYTGRIDVAVTPLLAVNERGFRLGYGGGFYDRYFLGHADILKVGYGYFLQLCGDDFGEEGDVPLDLFVCERGIIDFGRK